MTSHDESAAQAKIDQLEQRLQSMEALVQQQLQAPDLDEPRTDRRRFLKLAGAAAAGIVGVQAINAQQAAAADGANLLLGTANDADATTTISTTVANDKPILKVDGSTAAGGPARDGLHAIANDSVGAWGVYGKSNNGAAVVGNSANGYAFLAAGGSRIGVGTHGPDVPSPGSAYATGDIARDDAGSMFVCVAGGNPGTWRKIAGTGTAGQLHILPAAKRCYDSRAGQPPLIGTKTPIDGGTTRTAIDTKANSTGVPSGATAVMVNLAVTNTSAAGWVALFANGVAYPGTSNINFASGETTNTLALVPCGANGLISAYASVQTDIILDIVGYYL